MLTLINVSMNNIDKHLKSKCCTCFHLLNKTLTLTLTVLILIINCNISIDNTLNLTNVYKQRSLLKSSTFKNIQIANIETC